MKNDTFWLYFAHCVKSKYYIHVYWAVRNIEAYLWNSEPLSSQVTNKQKIVEIDLDFPCF